MCVGHGTQTPLMSAYPGMQVWQVRTPAGLKEQVVQPVGQGTQTPVGSRAYPGRQVMHIDGEKQVTHGGGQGVQMAVVLLQ